MTMMYTPTIPSPDPNTRTPKFKLPRRSCDAHCHIFGPGASHPAVRAGARLQQKILVDNPARLFGFDDDARARCKSTNERGELVP